MAEVPSTFRLVAGSLAPDFALPDGRGIRHSLGNLADGKAATVIVFACNHCPFVVHLAESLGRRARDWAGRGVQTIAINANDTTKYPADAPDRMPGFAEAHGWDFPYLVDADQSVAKAYAAACTPDFYLFDRDLRLAYAGQYDTSRPGKGVPTGDDLARAIDTLLETGAGPAAPWLPSTGCNIKWLPGNAPDYF
ncbi:MAG: thioredoxin family protein [Verrucomicrobiales bacterium]|nr:thioredoxin family protein [Verrucomicrobiales bacterium]